MATFEERVQSLPAEIYNEIYDLTFKTAPDIVIIDKSYQPPALLRVNRATRNTFAASYYGPGPIFYVDRAIAREWLLSIASADFRVQSEVRITNSLIQATPGRLRDLNFLLCREWIDIIGSPIHGKTRIRKGPARLKFQVLYGEPEKKVWTDFQDLPQAGMNAWMGRDAKDWFDWKFGK